VLCVEQDGKGICKRDCSGDSTGLVDCSWLESTNGVSVMVAVHFDSEKISLNLIDMLKKREYVQLSNPKPSCNYVTYFML
jgi:hypothetical protein